MKTISHRNISWVAISACLLFAVFDGALPAQTTTQTESRSGTVVYASGNDVVVKRDDGVVKHFVVPESTMFNIDGKDVSVHELKPGMHLTRTVTTVTKSENVRNVKVVKGKVWMVNAPYLIVTLDSGQNKQFKAPDGMKFNVNGEEVSVFHLKKGMNLTATVVTTTPETIASSTSSVTGSAPVEAKAPPKPATPTQVGALLIDESPAAQPVDVASNQAPPAAPEEKPARLPKTGSSVPLLGLLGLISLSAGLALRIHRVR